MNKYHDDIFHNAFTFASIGMALVSPNGAWLKVNKSLCDLVGYTEEQLLAKTFQDITHPEDLDEDLHHVEQMLAGIIETYQMEKRYFHNNGNIITVLLSVSLVRTEDGAPKFFISQIQDITKKKQLEKQLTTIATEDFLTKVFNRRYFFEHVSRELTRGDRFHEPQALMMLDIDHFKKVNDTHGHDVGDEVLKAMAKCCKDTLRGFDVFGRIGGEEFAAFLINTDAELAGMIAERIRSKIENLVVHTAEGEIRFTISIGLTAFVGGKKSIEDRLKQADKELYKAKNNGRNRVQCNIEIPAINAASTRMKTSFFRLTWKKEYQCGNNIIDGQHMQLFDISNNLLTAIITGLPVHEVETIANELVTHSEKHFHDEEAIFRSAAFPEADAHVIIHNNLLNEMRSLVKKYHLEQLSVGELFEYLAVKIVAGHLLSEDRDFFPYLS
ncbi:MAG: diguanylate cyclase [Proteobacteria bacterium]|nr:diguanylate cyclase [Pseudomonadota bacterium]